MHIICQVFLFLLLVPFYELLIVIFILRARLFDDLLVKIACGVAFGLLVLVLQR